MNALDIMKYGHLTVCRAIDELPEPDWETGGVCGYWSVKDIIGHLAAFEHVLIEVLSSFLDGGETPHLDLMRAGPLEFNDIEADKRKNRSKADLLLNTTTLRLKRWRWPGGFRRKPGRQWERCPGTARNTLLTTMSCTLITGANANTARRSPFFGTA